MMLDNNTASKMRDMRLGVMAAAFKKQIEDKAMADLSFDERVGLMVDAAATIKLLGTEYETPQHYIGAKVKIRYLPTDMSELFIFSDDNKLLHTVRPVKKVENSKIKRASIDYTKAEGAL